MLQVLQKQGERLLSVSRELARRWTGSVALASAVAIAYFLASQLSFFLRTNHRGPKFPKGINRIGGLGA